MPPADESLEHTRMTLGEHLEELRKRVFRSVLAVAVVFGLAWWQQEPIQDWFLGPWHRAVERINDELVERAETRLAENPEIPRSQLFETDDPADQRLRERIDPRLNALAMGDMFFFALNITIYVSLFAAGPFVLWQLWQFVAAGLYRHERRLVRVYFPFSALLFAAGVAFCFYLVVPLGSYFLTTAISPERAKLTLSLPNYLSFLTTMCLAMGLVFQLPIVMIFFARIGVVDPRTYAKSRGYFLVGALLVAAVLTPGPDVYSQLLMTAPMLILYEIGAIVSRFAARPRRAS